MEVLSLEAHVGDVEQRVGGHVGVSQRLGQARAFQPVGFRGDEIRFAPCPRAFEPRDLDQERHVARSPRVVLAPGGEAGELGGRAGLQVGTGERGRETAQEGAVARRLRVVEGGAEVARLAAQGGVRGLPLARV